MASTEARELISPCGLYCGVCPLYRARTDEVLRGKIAGAMNVPIEAVFLCPGCRPLKGECPQAGGNPVCETYACAGRKGVRYCYECADFSCLKLAPCADRAREIPHNTKVYHLALLKKMGEDAWLELYPGFVKQYLGGGKPRPGGEIQFR